MRITLLTLLLLALAAPAHAQLYGIDNVNDNLIGINTDTGAATVIGTLGIDVVGTGATFAPDGTLWMLARVSGTDALYTVDLLTGAATFQLEVFYNNNGGISVEFNPDGSTLYVSDGPELGIIDLGDGSIDPVGDMGFGTSNFTLTVDESGLLYSITQDEDLATINPGTATTAIVGPLGVSGNFAAAAFDWDGNRIYSVESGSDTLYRIDPDTGTATSVGSIGVGFGGIGGMAYLNESPVNTEASTWGALKDRYRID